MLRIVDATVVLALVRGELEVIHRFAMTRRREVAVPEPVISHVMQEVGGMAQRRAGERWAELLEHLPRLAWNAEVTEMIAELEPPRGRPVDLDTITAAYALVSRGKVYTREPERYEWVRRLKIDAI